MLDRRLTERQSVDVYFNKYVDGHPYLCRSLNLSHRGLRALSLSEPENEAERFAIELRLPGDDESLWVWARRAWTIGTEQAIEFVAMAPQARAQLDRYLAA